MGKQLYATKNELKHAFQKHYSLYKELVPNSHQMTRRLVLFYTVETGLKYYLLGIIRKSNTDELQEYYDGIGHDINRMLKYANCGGQFTLKCFSTSTSQSVAPNRLHEMWRYGIKAQKSSDDGAAEKVLNDIASWLEISIQR
ncbi:hypothetical protein AGMMS50267_18530 [Spirochaetia bacterium]|nr:hypothetical protein AGMMS50267_18530 [Spirochaetia bacterium]